METSTGYRTIASARTLCDSKNVPGKGMGHDSLRSVFRASHPEFKMIPKTRK